MADNFLKDYIPVNTRLEEFWAKYPEGRVETSLLRWENGVVAIKAQVWRNIKDEFPAATGHAHEVEGDSYINKTSALENCETSAVGRALAMLGFEIKAGVASKEEVERAQARAESRPAAVTPIRPEVKEDAPLTATEAQVGKLFSVLKTKGLNSDEASLLIKAQFKKPANQLTKVEASKAIDSFGRAAASQLQDALAELKAAAS